MHTTTASRATSHATSQATLRDDERQPCEVWTRVMGYHRPVSSFNIGKRGEHAERRFFVEHAFVEQARAEPTATAVVARAA